VNTLRARKVDRWLGAPLRLLATGLCVLRDLFRPREPERPVRRILFILVTETGGLITAYPALQEARRRFPGARIAVLTSEMGLAILPHLGLKDEGSRFSIRTASVTGFLLDALRVVRRLRREKFDATVNLEAFMSFGALLAFATGAPRRAGFDRVPDAGRSTGALTTHRVAYNPHQHVSRAFLDLVAALAGPSGPGPHAAVPAAAIALEPPRSSPAPASRESLAALIEHLSPGAGNGRRLVVINPNAGDLAPVRRWPLASYRSLALGLLEIPDVLLAFTGVAAEREAARSLCRDLDPARALDLTGRTTFDELLALYERSTLLITNDSGPAHFAALVDLPVLVLFGPETPKIFRPLGHNVHVLYRDLACSPCLTVFNQKSSSCGDNRCLTGITPLEVLERATAILSAARA
jgi:ADP-heptose:LPS heptosyltransferase